MAARRLPGNLHAMPVDVPPLGSGARRGILEFLTTGEKTVAEIASGLGMHPATLRYHLGLLLRQRLIEESRPQASYGRGRPAIRYRTPRHVTVPGFPPRRYELLASAALKVLVDVLGPERAAEHLARNGLQTGEAIIAGLAERIGTEPWGPEAFERILLADVFRDFGITTQVVSRSSSEITYRFFTCPFLELAEQLPKLVCDSMDKGVHSGLDRGLSATTERLACMGHGDPHCEYRTQWVARGRVKSRRSARGRTG